MPAASLAPVRGKVAIERQTLPTGREGFEIGQWAQHVAHGIGFGKRKTIMVKLLAQQGQQHIVGLGIHGANYMSRLSSMVMKATTPAMAAQAAPTIRAMS